MSDTRTTSIDPNKEYEAIVIPHPEEQRSTWEELTRAEVGRMVAERKLEGVPVWIDHKSKLVCGTLVRGFFDESGALRCSFRLDHKSHIGRFAAEHIAQEGFPAVSMSHRVSDKAPVELSLCFEDGRRKGARIVKFGQTPVFDEDGSFDAVPLVLDKSSPKITPPPPTVPENKSQETKPVEVPKPKPEEQKTVDASVPVSTVPDNKSQETKSTATLPPPVPSTENKTTETKPADIKPAEAKPEESKEKEKEKNTNNSNHVPEKYKVAPSVDPNSVHTYLTVGRLYQNRQMDSKQQDQTKTPSDVRGMPGSKPSPSPDVDANAKANSNPNPTPVPSSENKQNDKTPVIPPKEQGDEKKNPVVPLSGSKHGRDKKKEEAANMDADEEEQYDANKASKTQKTGASSSRRESAYISYLKLVQRHTEMFPDAAGKEIRELLSVDDMNPSIALLEHNMKKLQDNLDKRSKAPAPKPSPKPPVDDESMGDDDNNNSHYQKKKNNNVREHNERKRQNDEKEILNGLQGNNRGGGAPYNGDEKKQQNSSSASQVPTNMKTGGGGFPFMDYSAEELTKLVDTRMFGQAQQEADNKVIDYICGLSSTFSGEEYGTVMRNGKIVPSATAVKHLGHR